METFTIAEAASLTGLTKKAIRNRVDRGQLRAVLRDGVRRIPRSELERAGLPLEALPRPDPSGAASPTSDGQSDLTHVIRELVERIERQATELAELRVLTRTTSDLADDRTRLESQLFEAKARILELERRRFRLWTRRAA